MVRAIVIMANVAKRNFIRTNVVGTCVCALVKIIAVVGTNAFRPNVIRANLVEIILVFLVKLRSQM